MSKVITWESGRRYRPAGSGLPTPSAATDALEKAEQDYRAGRRVDDGGMTVRQGFDYWLNEKKARRPKLSSNTIANYEGDADEWCSILGERNVESLQPRDIRDGIKYIGRKKDLTERPPGFRGRWVSQVTVSTLERKRTAIRNMLKFLKADGKVSRNVATAEELPSLGSALPQGVAEDEDYWPEDLEPTGFDRRWSVQQTADFLDAVLDHRFAVLYTEYVYTAARRGEWIGARRDALKAQGLEVRSTVRVPKRGQSCVCPACGQEHRGRRLVARAKNTTTRKGTISPFRWFPIPDEGWELLQRHLVEQQRHIIRMGAAYNDHKLIFCEEDGTPLYPGTVTAEFDKLVDALKLPSIRLHDLRHQAVSLFLAADIDIEIVAKMTGHDVRVCREVYASLKPELTSELFQRANDTITRLRGKTPLRVVPETA